MQDLTRREFLGAGVGIALSTALPSTMLAETRGALVPIQLTCEQQANPIGIDEASPRLSWKLTSVHSEARSLRQTGYRVLVSSSWAVLDQNHGDLWDSGKVESSESILIAYEGKPLVCFTRCWWKAMVWDQFDAESPWSEPASWEMALVDEKDWRGKWIQVPDAFLSANEKELHNSIKLGQWIWPISQSRVYMRKFFDLTGHAVKRALLEVHCDNDSQTYLNGKSVAFEVDRDRRLADVTALLRPAGNFWGFKAWQSNDPSHFSAAMRSGLEIQYADGSVQYVVSDASWQFGIMGGYFENADPANWSEKPEVGNWSGPPTAVNIHPGLLRRSVFLRKSFKIEEPIADARLYATAWGLHDVTLNGARVSDARLAPGCSEKAQYYQTFEVTRQLRQGENVACAALGSGWLNSRYYGDMFAHKSAFRMHLRIKLISGRVIDTGTDSDWKLHFSPLVDNDLQWGERYDARLEIPGWNEAGFNDSDWKNAEAIAPVGVPPLRSQPFESIRVKAEVKANKVSRIGDKMFLFDFGQNAPGRCRVVLRNTTPGQIVVMKYGERLGEDGMVQDDVYSDVFYPGDNKWETGKASFMTRNLDTYICRGAAEEVYEPRFVYTGFRYGQLSGFTGTVDIDTMTQLILHTDFPVAGTVETSSPIVNDIWKAIVWSIRGNHHSGPTDCPTREKNFWNGDASVFAETACWYGNFSRLYAAWTVWGRKVPATEVAWIDEIITIPWIMCTFYDDLRPATQQYDAMTALVNGRLLRASNHLYLGEGERSIGDHVSLNPVPLPFFNGAIHIQSLDRVAQLAKALGRTADAEKYEQAATNARLAFEQHFVGADGRLNIAESQSAYVMALAFDLVRPDLRKQLGTAFMSTISARQFHPTTGFVCTPFLLSMVSELGSIDDAWKMVTQETMPSWGFMLKSGSTTITETWEAQTASPGSGTSMNHFALGSIGRWFFEYIGGINFCFAHKAFGRIQLRPFLPRDLMSADVTYESVRGSIRSAWKKQDGSVEWQISVPPNTTAEVFVPYPRLTEVREGDRSLPSAMKATIVDDRIRLQIGSGRYIFRWPSQ